MSLKPSDWTVDYFLKNESDCMKALEKSDVLKEIPSLNYTSLDYFKNGQVAHFRGMLQDMYNPEYFLKNYQVVNKQTGERNMRSGMYIDGALYQPDEQVELDSNENESSERHTWVVISTPGLNNWAKENPSVKMSIDEQFTKSNTNKTNKRSLETEEPMDCSEPQQKKEKAFDNNDKASFTELKEKESNTTRIFSKDHILNFPLPNEDGKACIVKVYQDFPYKLNQVFDIIGFLSLDPNLSEIYDSGEMDTDLERQTHHPPVSMVPRLHAIYIIDEKNKYTLEPHCIYQKAESIRGDLRMVLSQLLFGDQIAADYLICHLISSVYLRRDCLTLGAFTINITNFPNQYKNFSKDLYEILKQLVEKSHFIDMTLENLNDMCLLPKKDYDCDRLTSGILQLSKNTHLIIDETNLTTGQVTAFGRQNYNTINDLIIFQKLPYDFKYYTVEYETDIPVLILSESKSFIPCQNQIILKPDPEAVKLYPQILAATKQYLKDETRLIDIRQYICTLKTATFEFTDETAEVIQEDFVRIRQSHKTFSADNLHSLMVFSRLMALSHGVNTLKPDLWKRCLDIEMERLSRLPTRK